jgi:hypothetical protein
MQPAVVAWVGVVSVRLGVESLEVLAEVAVGADPFD